MALSAQSLILYGLEITDENSSIDFKISGGGSELQATLTLGFYSLTDLLIEIKSELESTDTLHTYTVTADRTTNGGEENRITISTSGTFLSLLFGSGTRTASSVATLIGFTATDKTGSTTYTGSGSAGTVLLPALNGYNYLGPDNIRKVFGSVNLSASGVKEAIVYQIQQFIQVQFKYEPSSVISSDWTPFLEWAISQKPFDFTPEITSPTTFYNVTLDRTEQDGQGLMFSMREMLPQFPNFYDTGMLTMRRKASTT